MLDPQVAQHFNPQLPASGMRTPQALQGYLHDKRVVGADGRTYSHGGSVRTLDLRGKSAAAIDHELTQRGFVRRDGVIRYRDGSVAIVNGQTARQIYYLHPDGSMIRIKPDGDPTNARRPQPHISKSVRHPPNASHEDFSKEAFKVDSQGNPLPKDPASSAVNGISRSPVHA
jgi:hypothetical protein